MIRCLKCDRDVRTNNQGGTWLILDGVVATCSPACYQALCLRVRRLMRDVEDEYAAERARRRDEALAPGAVPAWNPCPDQPGNGLQTNG